MLASTSRTTACCRQFARHLAARSMHSTATHPSEEQSNNNAAAVADKRVFAKTLKVAVRGQREVNAGATSKQQGSTTSPTEFPLHQHGFARTASRGDSKSAVAVMDEDEMVVVKKTSFGRATRSRKSLLRKETRSFSTSARSGFAPSPSTSRQTLDVEEAVEEELETDESLTKEASMLKEKEEPLRQPSARLAKQRSKSLTPGTWVETRRNGIAIDGIFLGRSPSDPRRILILSLYGTESYEALMMDDVTFVGVPLVSATLAAQCLSLNPLDPVVAPLRQQLRQLEIRTESATRDLVKSGAMDLYERFTKGKKPMHKTSASGALRLLGLERADALASPEYYLAMHRILIADAQHFIADPLNLRTSGTFKIRSPVAVAAFELVRGWVRERTPELVSFAKKASKIRQYGLEHPPGGFDGTSQLTRVPMPEIVWTKSDLQILIFLRVSLENEREIQLHPYMAIAPTILKLVDDYTKEAGHAIDPSLDVGRIRIMSFLAEVGVVALWENWTVHEQGHIQYSWQIINKAIDQAAASEKDPSIPLPHSLRPGASPNLSMWAKPAPYLEDAHDSVRHDFGQLPVYTIDDAGAMELDDGVSIEAGSPTSKGGKTNWVHVHVADPTAVLDPFHRLSNLARLRDHTEYFPERTWSMFPDSFIVDQKMSLGAMEGKEQRTVTFSMRMDESGEVLESDVKVGIVRNVKRLTYSAVDEILGYTPPPPSTVLTFPILPPNFDLSASRPPSRTTDDAFALSDSTTSANLKALHNLARALIQRRTNDNALYWTFPASHVSVTPQLSHHHRNSPSPAFYTTSPLISLRLPSLTPPGSASPSSITPSQLLVSELMVSANRTASKFAVLNRLAMPFRAQAAPLSSPEAISAVLKLRDPTTGEARGEDVTRLGIDFLPGTTSVEPGVHWPMGIQDEWGYVRVTSPLRRYGDLVGHWQLKSALLPKSRKEGITKAPFGKNGMSKLIEGFEESHKSRGRLGKHAENFWASYLVREKLRGVHSGGGGGGEKDELAEQVLTNLTAMAIRKGTLSLVENVWVQQVLIPELGLRAQLQCGKEGETLGVGESGRVKVREVLVGSRSRMIVERW